jgi:hypothetical protein
LFFTNLEVGKSTIKVQCLVRAWAISDIFSQQKDKEERQKVLTAEGQRGKTKGNEHCLIT